MPCLNQNSEITEYRVHVGFTSSLIRIAHGIVINGESYTQTGLTAGIRYFFQVYTVTSDYSEGTHADRINIVAKCESIIVIVHSGEFGGGGGGGGG